jgi:hypothetical protein
MRILLNKMQVVIDKLALQLTLSQLEELDARTKAAIEPVIRAGGADLRLSVTRAVCRQMLGIGESKQLELERNDEIDAFIDGGQWKIVTASIYRKLVMDIIASRSADGSPKFIKRKSTFRKAKRPVSDAQQRALDVENERRRADAARRREAEAAS